MAAVIPSTYIRLCICIWVAALFLSVPGVGHAQESRPVIALLPVADLSAGVSSWDQALQRTLHAALLSSGFDLVEPERVMEEVRALRLRDLGEVDRFACRQLGIRLGCTNLLSVSIVESTGGNTPTLGLLLQLYHAASGTPVWGEAHTYSAAGQIALLGLQQDMDLEGLLRQATKDLVDSLGRISPDGFTPGTITMNPNYAVEVIDCSQTLVRCGGSIRCRIKIRTEVADISAFTLELGGRNFDLHPSSENGELRDIYVAQLEAPITPGVYPVRLKHTVVESALTLTTVTQIEAVSEAVHLELESSAVADAAHSAPVFSRRLTLRPRMQNKRPVDTWTFEVLDSRKNQVLSQQRSGDLPAALNWAGIDARRYPLPSGVYTVNLHIQDVAGFATTASTEVYLHQAQEELATLDKVHKEGKTALLLRDKNPAAESRAWKVYITDSNDNELYKISGTTLPAKIVLPQKVAQEQELFCQLYVQDSVGNRYWTKTTPVGQYIAADSIGTEPGEMEEQKLVWNSGF